MKNMNPEIGGLTFDEWVLLAKNDPDKFKQQHENAIKAFIEKQDEGKRLGLLQLQFKIEAVRFKYRNSPYLCAEVLNKMMWRSLVKYWDIHLKSKQTFDTEMFEPSSKTPHLRIVSKD